MIRRIDFAGRRPGRTSAFRQPAGSVALAVAWLALACSAWGGEPLHARIDRLLDDARTGPAAPPSGDAAFFRRLHLDLWGVIPTADEVRAFLDDPSPHKRAAAIDRLLDDARFVRRMTIVFDRMLMERRRQKHIKPEQWRAWLYEQLAKNRPLNEWLSDILAADGADEATRPAAAFLLDREAETHLLTRDVGRIFLGVDLQCAQCHDHPLISDYHQQDYYGLYAFLQRSSLFTDPKSKQAYVAEKAEGDITYTSVFIDGEKHTAAPHLPGQPPIEEPAFPKGEEYVVKPAKNVRSVPKFSVRGELARQFASGKSRQFTRNLANRLWALMFGRGIVAPVDLHHSENPPTHPQLLELLTDELAAMEYDVRAFLREIALSRAYQQSHRMPDGLQELASQAEALLADAQAQVAQAEDAMDEAVESSHRLREQLAAAEAELKEINQKTSQALDALAEAEKHAAVARQSQREAETAAAAKSQAAEAVAGLAAQAAKVAAALAEDRVVAETAATLQSHAKQLAAEADQASRQAEQLAAKAEQAARELAHMQTEGEQLTAARQEVAARRTHLEEERQALDRKQRAAQGALLAVQAKVEDVELLAAYGRAAAQSPDSEEAAAAWSNLVQRWSERALIARLRPLDPEQFALSVLQATGVLGPRRLAAEKAAQEKSDGKEPADRAVAVEQAVYEQSQKEIQAFVSTLSHGEGPAAHEYEATVDEALFLANSSQVDGWLRPRSGNRTQRLAQLDDPAAVAEELYLSVLSRRPDDQEKAAVAEFLCGRQSEDRSAAIREMIWGLLTSAEFRFNH